MSADLCAYVKKPLEKWKEHSKNLHVAAFPHWEVGWLKTLVSIFKSYMSFQRYLLTCLPKGLLWVSLAHISEMA